MAFEHKRTLTMKDNPKVIGINQLEGTVDFWLSTGEVINITYEKLAELVLSQKNKNATT